MAIATGGEEVVTYFDTHSGAVNRAVRMEIRSGTPMPQAGLNAAALVPPIGVFKLKDRAYYKELRTVAKNYSRESRKASKGADRLEAVDLLTQRAFYQYKEIAEKYGDVFLPQWFAYVITQANSELG